MSNQSQHKSQDINVEQRNFTTTFFYQIANMKAMKIVVLIRFSKLPYVLQEITHDEQKIPYNLRTSQGQLTKEYEIISYIVMQSKDAMINNKKQNPLIRNLCGQDLYTYVKMNQILINLRMNLFPLLEQFYKYLLGHMKIKKTKYDSLIGKIKKQITILDSTMNQHSQIFTYQYSFLIILIMCQLFIACKFVFQEKFRKSKYSLFNKYEKLSKMIEFQQIYGKTKMCLKQYVPPEFQIQQQPLIQQNNNNNQIPIEISKLQNNILNNIGNNRNQLLYNYFKSILITQQQSKKKYFPYFWMMFDQLQCNLVHIEKTCLEQNEQIGIHNVKILEFQLEKYLKTQLDYGMIGLYQQNNKYFVKGCLCLASKSVEQLENDVHNSIQMKECVMRKINYLSVQQRNDVQNIWQNVIEHTFYNEINLCMIVYI